MVTQTTMNFVKLLKRSHWVFITIFVLLLAIQFFHTQHFLSRSTNTNATVISVAEQSPFKSVTLRYVTDNQTVLENTIPLISTDVKTGDQLAVRYNRIIPVQVRVENFIETWSASLLYAALTVISVLSFALVCVTSNWCIKRAKKLQRDGNHIYTQYKSIEADIKAEKNGKYPYRIISTWFDPKTKKQYEFKSQHLWNNPQDYIMDQTIKVMIDIKNKRKYLMDLSFLPDNILKN